MTIDPTASHRELPATEPVLSADKQALVRRLAVLQARAPSPAFQQRITAQALQHHVHARAARQRQQRLARPPLRWSVAGPLIVVLAALVLSTIGTGYATAASLPGEPLYPVKRQLEAIRLAASRPTAQAALQQTLLTERLHELERLVARQATAAQLTAAVANYQATLAQVTYATPPGPGAQIAPLLRQHLAALAAIQPQVPASTQPQFDQAAQAAQTALDQLGRPARPADTNRGPGGPAMGRAPVAPPQRPPHALPQPPTTMAPPQETPHARPTAPAALPTAAVPSQRPPPLATPLPDQRPLHSPPPVYPPGAQRPPAPSATRPPARPRPGPMPRQHPVPTPRPQPTHPPAPLPHPR